MPVAGVLCLSSEWRSALSLPEPSRSDWSGVVALRGTGHLVSGNPDPIALPEDGQRGIVSSVSRCLKTARSMSFLEALHSRMLSESRAYADAGIRSLLLDFGFAEQVDETAVYWISRLLAEDFVHACDGEFRTGICMDDDNWAVDIACRFGYNAVLCSDSCSYHHVVAARNRATDGTAKAKPTVFAPIYVDTQLDGSMYPEGIFALDREKVDGIANALPFKAPIACDYNGGVMQGENPCCIAEWGAVDHVLVDLDARKGRLMEIDVDALSSIVECIGKWR